MSTTTRTMNVPLLDLKAQYQSIKAEIDAAVAEVFQSQHFILGPHVKQCEEQIASYSSASHAVGVSSGSDALLIALMAENIGPGDEVITTPYSFFATAGCIARLGATAVFVDIDPQSYNINPALIEERITDRTRAIIPVHLFGQMADMDRIMEIAGRHKLVVIEDAAQAIGAEYKGQRAGSIGDYGCFSFFPSKNLGAAGDGGIVTTQDAERAERLTILRAHGGKPKYFYKLLGGNFRLDSLQAAVVTVKLRYLDQWTAARQENAAKYDRLLDESGLVESGQVVLPVTRDVAAREGEAPAEPRTATDRHIYNQYVIRVEKRDALRDHLKQAGVATEIYYPRSLHEQECFANLNYQRGDFPEAEKAADETVALPVYPELTAEQIVHVVEALQSFYHGDAS